MAQSKSEPPSSPRPKAMMQPHTIETPFGSVEARAVPLRVLNDAVERRGISPDDYAARRQLTFFLGVVDPNFTEAEAEQFAQKYSPLFHKIIDLIDKLSGCEVRVHFDPRIPRRHRQALRAAAQLTHELRHEELRHGGHVVARP